MPGTLFVVATPIGNLEDVTMRALRVLREVAVIAAEDTRRTARLLQHYSISTQTTSLHEHNERSRAPQLIERLRRGDSVALVSDAGTPIVSDPGTLLVAAAHEAGIRVEAVPGPSAAVAAVSVSGLPADQVLFVGFPPSKSSARKRWLSALQNEPRLLVFFEAPHRVRGSLLDILEILGDRQAVVARELTKAHEQLVFGPMSQCLERLTTEKGEFTIVVSGASPEDGSTRQLPAPEDLRRELGELTNIGVSSRREALRGLAERYGVSTSRLYRYLEQGATDAE